MSRYLIRLTGFTISKENVIKLRGLRQFVVVSGWTFADGNIAWKLEKKS